MALSRFRLLIIKGWPGMRQIIFRELRGLGILQRRNLLNNLGRLRIFTNLKI